MMTVEDFVRREVIYCVSGLIHTLADLENTLGDQARDLYSGQPDYESAARDAGWLPTAQDGWWQKAGEVDEAGPRDLCGNHNIEPYYPEIYEHWIISDWLADKLIEKGEVVDKDFAGLTVWGRSTTGQAISMDYVIQEIYKEMMK